MFVDQFPIDYVDGKSKGRVRWFTYGKRVKEKTGDHFFYGNLSLENCTRLFKNCALTLFPSKLQQDQMKQNCYKTFLENAEKILCEYMVKVQIN